MYQIYLLDIDNTLLDFDATEIKSFHTLLNSYEITYEEELFTQYKKINKNFWALLEQGKVDKDTVRTGRFIEFFGSLNLSYDADEAERRYQSYLSDGADMMPNAKETLINLKEAGKKIYSASNGVYETQVKRLKTAGLYDYFEEMFVSEKIGHEKPDRSFFDYCFDHIKDFDVEKTIMVGDSLTSDIQGAINSGIDSCFYDPKGAITAAKATHTISNLNELLSL
ncbi:YjjG family noncanonical pyrimidine nucleotidase [Lacrimispora sp.]|uniref:YjjG family noncanonical pyrimidine nucleotidase n=1 Tax=Lacrimispora sp. TaxID=2719234 RepID=UPI0028B126A6|nr:YjjG family noncanonical pyrimidine nucleotidase [Lacrimispora sp.]